MILVSSDLCRRPQVGRVTVLFRRAALGLAGGPAVRSRQRPGGRHSLRGAARLRHVGTADTVCDSDTQPWLCSFSL